MTSDSRSLWKTEIYPGSLKEIAGTPQNQNISTQGSLEGHSGGRGSLHLLCTLMTLERGCGSEPTRCSMFCCSRRRVTSSFDSMHPINEGE